MVPKVSDNFVNGHIRGAQNGVQCDIVTNRTACFKMLVTCREGEPYIMHLVRECGSDWFVDDGYSNSICYCGIIKELARRYRCFSRHCGVGLYRENL